jgi:hypothetical protein
VVWDGPTSPALQGTEGITSVAPVDTALAAIRLAVLLGRAAANTPATAAPFVEEALGPGGLSLRLGPGGAPEAGREAYQARALALHLKVALEHAEGAGPAPCFMA